MAGFYIKELRVTGIGVQDASVIFEKGLNVINGPSNTGKSYIFNCIDYIFGASKLKTFKLSESYDDVFLEIRDNVSDRPKTIYRSISNANRIYYSDTDISGFVIRKDNKLLADHDAKNENNISRFLLKQIGLSENKQLLTNQSGKKKGLGFRGIANLSLINETKIISDEESPIFNKVKTDESYCKSLFRYLLTQVDDAKCEEIEKKEIRKARLESKIEYIEQEISELKVSLIQQTELLEKSDASIRMEIYGAELAEVENRINTKKSIITQCRKEQNELNNQKNRFSLLLERFSVLKEQYTNDLERLEFIHAGGDFLDQLTVNACPVCNNEMVDEIPKDDISDLFAASMTERRKLSSYIEGLESTISDTNEQLMDINIKMGGLQETIDKEICVLEGINSSELVPLKSLMNDYMNYLDITNKIESINARIVHKLNDLESYEQKLAQKQGKLNYDTKISSEIIKELMKTIEKTLVSWGYSDKENIEVLFDEKEQDIVINGQPRKSNGKGYRAFFYAAFSVSLMDYLISKNAPFSKVIILDSPVTTLKENEIKSGNFDEGDIIDVSMQDKMFESLSKCSSEKQVIIIENKELPTGLTNCNHIAFTKGERAGRYGFFPVSD
ncbi:hypothetical protein SY83_05540 [Paenibacillus swuensis]|uniref:Rad50/SbcC-type AAA domain-containing protein n=1 Tax=Paenibacillus swuensis TaxID=1178515 RepID=A0A172TG50_9BACL|nr:hypothetical protein [Paenibacillus swuensis]ANE45857.1 hypothetical protein SY83_05540 [Paenibacillus swuensis]